MYNKRLLEAMEHNSWYTLGTIYYEMAARVAEEGTDGAYLKAQGYKAKVQHQQEYLNNSAIDHVEILVNADGCKVCQPHQGTIYHSEDARLKNPIPVEDCLNEVGCRCLYLPVVEPLS